MEGSEEAQTIMQRISNLKNQIKEYDDLLSDIEDLEVLIELAIEEEDYQTYKEVEKGFKKAFRKRKGLNTTL